MNIEIIGHVCIDHNDSENSSYTAAGGPGTFMERVFIQFPDVDISMAASYGPDMVPYLDGIIIYPKTPNSSKTLRHQNVTKDEIKTTIVNNQDAAFPVKITDELRERIKNADIIFFTPLTSNLNSKYIEEIVDISNKDCLKVLLPQGYFWNVDSNNMLKAQEFEEASEIIPLVDVVVVGELDHPNIMQTAKNWAKDNKNLISVVTLGGKGAVVFRNGEEIGIPGMPVPENEVVDSVGSGDIFSAGFGYRYRQTHDINESGRFADALARQALFYPADKIKIDLSKIENKSS